MKIDNGQPEGGLRGVRTERYTYVVDLKNPEKTRILLFDRQTDPYQMKNIASENQPLIRELDDELNGWLKKFNDPWLKKRIR